MTPPLGPPGLQALQYLRKLCSHPLLVLDPAIPAHVAAVEKATQLTASTPAAWKAIQPCLHQLAHAPKLLALHQLLQVCPPPVHPADRPRHLLLFQLFKITNAKLFS